MCRWHVKRAFCSLTASLSMLLATVTQANSLQLAALPDQAQAWEIQQGKMAFQQKEIANLNTPLGSLWKLFVFSYLETNRIAEQPYHCQGASKEEVYCCQPGGNIERGAALVKSCGLYYEPARWQITPEQWRSFWQTHIPKAVWLQDLNELKPDASVPVLSLLEVLRDLPAQAKARDILLDNIVKGRGRELLPQTAAQLRVKTFSWEKDKNRVGGFAGWTYSGVPVWAMASGTSATVFQRWPSALADWVNQLNQPAMLAKTDSANCVDVDFFQRYPIQRISQSGTLHGMTKIKFENGNEFEFNAGNGVLNETNKKIVGRFSLNDYVARVIEREGTAEPKAAAQALAVVARTYVLQNAERDQACMRIADSTQTQRVSAEPPSAGAIWAAQTTDGLVLDAAVQYHQTEQKNGQLSWQRAVQQASNGASFDSILYKSFPQAQLKNNYTQGAECDRFTEAENYIQHWRKVWGIKLRVEAGYQPPGDVRICRVVSGKPYADRNMNTIFAQHLLNLNDQVTLAHEYCHLAFKYHPNTLNEDYIETLARKLVMEP